VHLLGGCANNPIGEGSVLTPFYDIASTTRTNMAKNTNTFEKRRKEIEKKRKADEKRERRRARGKGGDKLDESPAPEVEPDDASAPQVEPDDSPAPRVEGE
jgi:hypothetical protein